MEAPAANLYVFDNFRLDAHEKVLWHGDSVADVTPKAVEILLVLVEHAGRLVSKEEIIRVVWAESFVEEANLSHHIFRLRKALGESDNRKFIETVSKRGYRFVRQIDRTEDHPANGLPAPAVRSSEEEAQILDERPGSGSKSTRWIVLGVLFLSLVAGLFVWFRSGSATNVSRTPPEAISAQMSIARVTNNGKVGAATISPDGKFVAYSQNYTDGVGTLYVRQTDTNAEVQLLEPDERLFGSKAFSPDGSYIYYITYDKRDPEGALYRIPVIGGPPTRLLGDVRNMFTLSPDGKKVAFFRDEPEEKQSSLIVAAVDGSAEQKVLTRGYEEMKLGSCPAISPDGNSIAFAASENSSPSDAGVGQVNVFSVDIDNGRPKKISNEGLTDVGMVNWMPDGTGLVLVGERPRTGIQIYFLSYPSGELHRITKELSSYGNYGLGITADGTILVADLWDSSSQLWAIDTAGNRGDGQQLTSGISDGGGGLAALSDGSVVYTTRTGDDFDLWRMREKNGKREGTPLTADAFYERDVCATDDNRFLVFASNRAGGQHLFRMDVDASNTKQLTFGDGFDSAPDCSRDGTAVVYNSVLNNQALVWKVSIEGGSPVPLTDFECMAPSFSPDSRMIACIIPVDAVGKTATIAVISADGGPPEKTFEVVPFAWNYHAPRWTPDGKALVFGKRDKRPGNLWIQNLAGGGPRQFTDFKSQLIFNFAFSPDGKRLIVARGETKTNVVMIKNFKASLQ